jgi:hypothetical protein
MPAQRIRGQEVSVLIVRDGALEAELTDIQNFNLEIQTEIKSQGYLGEKSARKDDIFNGVKGDMELHLHSQDWFQFLNAVLDRAKRNTPDLVFNVSAVLFFPNGETPTITIPDVKFGPFPHNVPERGDYVKVKLDFEAEDFKVELT